MSTQAITQRMDKGQLTRYIDPDAPNPQQGRVKASRKEIETLRAS